MNYRFFTEMFTFPNDLIGYCYVPVCKITCKITCKIFPE